MPSTKLDRIWVVNFAGHNMTAAHDHLKTRAVNPFVYMTEGNINIFETDRIRLRFDEILKDFDPDRHALLLSGAAVLAALAVSSVLSRHESVDVLIWHARGRDYIRRQIRREGYASNNQHA